MSQVRRSTRKKRQTQLSFSPLPSSSPAASQYAEKTQQRAASVRYEDPMSNPRKKRRIASSNAASPFKSPKIEVVIPSPRKSADQLPTPAASSQIELDNERVSNQEEEGPPSASFSEDNAVQHPSRTVTNTKNKTAGNKHSSRGFTSEEEEDEDDIKPVRSTRRNRPALIALSSSDDSPQPQKIERAITPMRKSRLFQRRLQPSSTPPESDSEYPISRLQQKVSDSLQSTRDMNGGPGIEVGSSEAQKAKKGAKSGWISDGNESSSSEDVVATPVRRHNTFKRNQHSTRVNAHVEEDELSENLKEELEDLQEDSTPLRSTRSREGSIVSERSKRQQKLEELKRRRAGKSGKSQIEEEQDEWDENNESESSGPEPIHYATRRGTNLDEYEDDFIDNKDDMLGVDLGVAEVPLEFTYHINKKPFEHFKTKIK